MKKIIFWKLYIQILKHFHIITTDEDQVPFHSFAFLRQVSL